MECWGAAISEIGNIEDLPQMKQISSLRDREIATVSELPDSWSANTSLLVQKRNTRGPVVRLLQMPDGKKCDGVTLI